jgi:hypothetical protein
MKAGDEKLAVGAVFRRRRGFRRPPEGYPQEGWWTASSLYPSTDEGWEYLEIVEIVSTVTFGCLIVHREWWVDPDGNEVEPKRDWMPDKRSAQIRAEHSLLRSIASKKMEAVATRTAALTYDIGNMIPAGSA